MPTRSILKSDQRWMFKRAHAFPFLRSLPDAFVDAFVTDPPYGIELKLHTGKHRPRSIFGDGRGEAVRLWRAWIPEAYRVAKDNSAHIIFGSWKSPWMLRVLQQHFRVCGCIVWDKRQISLGYYLRARWELAFFCVKGKPPRRGTAPADVWSFTRINRPRHPCEKPVPLLAQAVRLVSDAGDVVCDPFAGIASTGVAAIEEGRRFLGCELDKRFIAPGRARLLAAEKAGRE